MKRFTAYLLVLLVLSACQSSTDSVLDIGIPGNLLPYGDSDPHDWTDERRGRRPWDYKIHGIDVAKYQGTINWTALKRAGIQFAFIKATEGGDHTDERFQANWLGAKLAGMPRGAYHFYYFCRPAFEQARWFIEHVPREPGALPPVLDMEWNHKSPSCDFRPEPPAVRREMLVFLQRLKEHYGKAPLIYTTIDFYRDNELWRIQGYEFWLRSVADHPEDLYPRQKWAFWQYTGTGRVSGIDGDTDINVFNGDAKAWKKWLVQNAR
jgi:lysozyme